MIIAAIDPGRKKTGIALVDSQGRVLDSLIVKTSGVDSYIIEAVNKYNIGKIILGDGTASSLVYEQLSAVTGSEEIFLQVVPEANSTREAAALYRRDNYPLWKRLLSRFVSWKPQEPIDDYAAVVLARRYLEAEKKPGRD